MKRVLILLGTLTASAAGTIAHAQAFAQTLPALEPRVLAVSDVIRGDAGSYGLRPDIGPDMGPVDYSLVEERGALPPRAIAAMLDDEGFSILSPPIRRGPAYVVAVIDANGDDGRVTVDAFSGRIIRFRPVTGPNAMVLPDDVEPGYTYARSSLRPPRSIPYVPPRNAPRAANRAQQSQAAPPQSAPAARTAARPPSQAATSAQAMLPAPGKPPVTVQPTQPMPPAMGFD